MWWRLNSGFQSDYYQRLISQYRPYRLQGTRIPDGFDGELDKLYILPLLTHKKPEDMAKGMIQKPNIKEKLSIWDLLVKASTETKYKRLVIIGVPGSGKTKLLEYITLAYADSNYRLGHPKAAKLIPVLLSFRQISKLVTASPAPSLAEVINKIIIRESGAQLNPPPEWFQNNLAEGRCLVMLDGLDEVYNPVLRSQISQWLDEQMLVYGETGFIVTSRPHGYVDNLLNNTKISLELQLFNPEQIEQFLKAWFPEEPEQKRATITAIKKNNALTAMAANPLILTVIALIEEKETLLTKRVEIYDQLCEALLYRREKAKMVMASIRLELDEKKKLLQILAFTLKERNLETFTLAIAEEILIDPLKGMAESVVTVGEFMEYIKNISGLIVEPELGVYQFCHGSFQDYLAVVHLKQTNQEKVLMAHLDQPGWRELILMYATISDVNDLIMAGWEKRTVSSMMLAYDCCSADNNPNPELQGKLLEWLDSALESRDLQIANKAAQVQLSIRLNYAVVLN